MFHFGSFLSKNTRIPFRRIQKYGNIEFKVNPGLSAISDALESSDFWIINYWNKVRIDCDFWGFYCCRPMWWQFIGFN